MYNCEICGDKADIHHIIHRSEGGFDIEINYKYLCALHHRGKNGPHQNQFVDLQYKIDMQTKLYSILPKEYYSPKEISQILGIHNNSLKRRIQKRGYNLYFNGLCQIYCRYFRRASFRFINRCSLILNSEIIVVCNKISYSTTFFIL